MNTKNNVVVTVSLPLELVNDLYRLARIEGQPVSRIVRQAVEQFVSQKPHHAQHVPRKSQTQQHQ